MPSTPTLHDLLKELRGRITGKLLPELFTLERDLARLDGVGPPAPTRSLLERVSDLMFMVDRGGLCWVNASAAEHLGRSQKALEASSMAAIITCPSLHGTMSYELLSSLCGRGSIVLEFATATGAVLTMGSEVHDMGEGRLLVLARRPGLVSTAAAHDIHDLRDASDLELQLRVPMAGVLGMAELLSATTLDPQQRELLETILANGRVMLELLDHREQAIRGDEFDFYRFLDDFARSYGRFAEKKGLKFDLVMDPAIPRHALGDVSRLRQVLSHLVSNAIKFTDEGEIQVTVVFTDDWRIRFVVEDTGQGLEDSLRDAIIACFRDREGACRSNKIGMGLAITRRLVTSLGGEMGLESTSGRGSRFWFSAVIHAASPPDATVDASRAAPQAPRRG